MVASSKPSPNVKAFPAILPFSVERFNQMSYLPGTSTKRVMLDAQNLGEMMSIVDLSLFFQRVKDMGEDSDEAELLEMLHSSLKEPKVRPDLLLTFMWRLKQSSTQSLHFSSAVAWTDCPKSQIFGLDRAVLARWFPKAASYLDQSRNHMRMIKRLVDGGEYSSCRMSADSCLLIAGNMVQDVLEESKAMSKVMQDRFQIKGQPCVVVVTETQIEKIQIGSYTFSGPLDYAVGIVDSLHKSAIRAGIFALDTQQSRCAVIEAKARFAFKGMRPQVIAQLASLCALRGTSCFAGALTDGSVWSFHLVRRMDNGGISDHFWPELFLEEDSILIIQALAFMIISSEKELLQAFGFVETDKA